MKIGIMGGTFDPIHNGHLIVAEYTRTSLKLDKIIFMPSGQHPFKDNKEITPSEKRMKMVSLAIESNPYFQTSSIEIHRVGITYTIDTILSLKEKYKNDDLYFIIGSDILLEIEKWKSFNQLINICNFALVRRMGEYKEGADNKLSYLREKYNIQIEEVKAPIIEISSTEIRQRLKKELSIKYLVPEIVEKYIFQHNLYNKENIDG